MPSKKPKKNTRYIAEVTLTGGPYDGQKKDLSLQINKGPLLLDMAQQQYDYSRTLKPNGAIPQWEYTYTGPTEYASR